MKTDREKVDTAKNAGRSKYQEKHSKRKFQGKSSRPKDDLRDQRTGTKEDAATKYSEKKGVSIDSYVGSDNDPKWYNRNTRLINDAAKIPLSNQLGSKLTWYTPADWHKVSGDLAINSDPIPGIFALSMRIVPGLARDASDGVNLATAGLFQIIRKNLSTVATYAPADAMMYIMGLDNIYAMYANITRLFGIINAYSAINLYMPDDLLRAGYGFNDAAIADLKTNLNNYRSRANNLIYKASSLYMPTDFTVVARHAWLFSNYFIDGASAKAQIYIHRMHSYYKVDETSSTQGTKLVCRDTGVTTSSILDNFNDMIEQYRNSDSMLRIAADMKRAFEGRGMWKLAYIDEGYMVLPSYSEEVLLQIHNTTILPGCMNAKDDFDVDWDVTQSVNKNIILFNPIATIPEGHAALGLANREALYFVSNKILNFYKDKVESDDILEATRNMVPGYMKYSSGDGAYKYWMGDIGVDVCLYAAMYKHGIAAPMPFAQVDLNHGGIDGANATVFDWAPMRLNVNSNNKVVDVWGDVCNYAQVDNDTLSRLNSNVMCSMWSIPEFGGFDA